MQAIGSLQAYHALTFSVDHFSEGSPSFPRRPIDGVLFVKRREQRGIAAEIFYRTVQRDWLRSICQLLLVSDSVVLLPRVRPARPIQKARDHGEILH